MRSRPLPPADRLHTGRSYGSWRDGVSSGRWRRTERRPPRTFRKRRGTWLGVPRYTARSAGSGLYPGMPRPAHHRCGTQPLRDRVRRRTTRHRANWWRGPRWLARLPADDPLPTRTRRSEPRSHSRWGEGCRAAKRKRALSASRTTGVYRTLRPVGRTEAPIGCTGDVRGLSAGFRPRHVELLTAPPAGHAARPSRERLPLTTARTDGVAIVAAFREAHGIVRPGDYAPLAGRPLDDLQERGRDLEQAATDLQDRPERIEPCDAVPRAAAELHVQVGLQTSPHSSHGLTSVRGAPHVSKGDARRQAPLTGL